MATLRIELQDGFAGDEVVCVLDGREVARRSGIQTNLAISRADALEVEVEDGPHELRVAVPTQGLETGISVDARGESYVAVRVIEGRLEAVALPEAPHYM